MPKHSPWRDGLGISALDSDDSRDRPRPEDQFGTRLRLGDWLRLFDTLVELLQISDPAEAAADFSFKITLHISGRSRQLLLDETREPRCGPGRGSLHYAASPH